MGRIWTRIINTLRGGAPDPARAIVDRQTLQRIEREIHDAEEQLGNARSSLAVLVAKSLVASRDVLRIETRLSALISDAERALEQDREDIALKIAAEIGELERLQVDLKHSALEYGAAVTGLRGALKASEENLARMKKQIEVVRTNNLLQQTCLSCSFPEEGPAHNGRNAVQSLNAILLRQLETAARLQAEEELNFPERDLERRLRNACISLDTPYANSVLNQIKNHRSPDTF